MRYLVHQYKQRCPGSATVRSVRFAAKTPPLKRNQAMRKLILATTALIVSGGAYAQTQDDWIVLRNLAVSVMQVQAVVNGRASYASGVALTPHLVVTNCHVLGTPNARLMRGVVSAAATLRVGDPRHDVCLLNVDAALASIPDIGRAEALKLGDRVYALGFGVGRLTTSVGQVEALYPYEGAVVVRTSAAFPMGASGGALFDSNKQLVGILTFYRHGHDAHAYYAVPIEWATQLAASSQIGLTSAQALPFWAAAGERQPWFLQAAGHEIDGEWGQMLAVAERWLEVEPSNNEAKRVLEFARRRYAERLAP